MKAISILIIALQLCCLTSFSQYIGVTAKYTESRVVNNYPYGLRRENRLILSFYEVSSTGHYTPAMLSNYDIWIQKEGSPLGSNSSGLLDSSGINYPGYPWTSPRVVSYYNSMGLNYIGCSPNLATKYTVNGHVLDCGFINVSYKVVDDNTGDMYEFFTAPNVILPFYFLPDPYYYVPGNVNFGPVFISVPGPDFYSFACTQSTQQLVIRGALPHDSAIISLPIRLANEKGKMLSDNKISISWSNMTESDINYYEVERATDGRTYQLAGIVFPLRNDGSRADYEFFDTHVIADKMFYRIKAIESNGNYLYSSILLIKNTAEENQSFTVFPNPVKNFQLSYSIIALPTGSYAISIINSLGQEKVLQRFTHNGGSISQSINLNGQAPGLYHFVIRSRNNLFTKKIIVQ